MKAIAKVVLFDVEGNVLKLVRSETHPQYPHEIDMPGGIVERSETPEQAVIRETLEETGLIIAPGELRLVKKQLAYWGAVEYLYSVYLMELKPTIVISWEHESWEWASSDDVMRACIDAKDSYMNLAAQYLEEGVFDSDSRVFAPISE